MSSNPAPARALQQLQDGNRRFVSNTVDVQQMVSSLRAEASALIGACQVVVLQHADVSLPAELLFDAALGQLKVLRYRDLAFDEALLLRVERALAATGAPLLLLLDCSTRGDAADAPAMQALGRLRERFAQVIEDDVLIVAGALWQPSTGTVKFFEAA
ncbi:MAG: hypothetical protein V2J89_08180 [Halieaceae bacterium]|jgi:hypothetical protein|nr:hypothetical protein [Halieaceae bacterium]